METKGKDSKSLIDGLRKEGYDDRQIRSYAAAERSWAKKGSKEWDIWTEVIKSIDAPS